MVVFLIGSYLRLYPPQWSLNRQWVTIGMITGFALSLISVCVVTKIDYMFNKNLYYWFVSDSNKPLSIWTAVFAFLFFKNLNIGYSKVINTIAASAFGVLLIHANSETMRQWLWRDTLNNASHFCENIYLHAIVSVIAVYAICTLIDFIRIQTIEKPFFKWFDRRDIKTNIG